MAQRLQIGEHERNCFTGVKIQKFPELRGTRYLLTLLVIDWPGERFLHPCHVLRLAMSGEKALLFPFGSASEHSQATLFPAASLLERTNC